MLIEAMRVRHVDDAACNSLLWFGMLVDCESGSLVAECLVWSSRCNMSFFFFSSRRRHTRCSRDWSSDVCSSDLEVRFCCASHNENRSLCGRAWRRDHRPEGALNSVRAGGQDRET